MRQAFTTVVAAIVLAAAAACGVSQTTAPSPAGPSTSALSMTMTTTPDNLTSDGGSQSAIVVEARNAFGGPQVGLAIRLDIAVAGTLEDCGTLSARTVVTDTNGRATAVYTAPAMPLPFPNCNNFAGVVTIIATPTGSNAQLTQTRLSTIRLTSPGTILPPAGSPTAAFTVSPVSPAANSAAIFDASPSTVGAGASQITSFVWSFGDGGSGTGKTVAHTFTSAGVFAVTLTVTNDRGLSASTTQSLTVAGSTSAPTVTFTVSPTPVVVGTDTFFNASASRAGAGHNIVNYAWDFGDSTSARGVSVTHRFAVAAVYKVTLTVTDDAGQQTTDTQDLTVTSGSPTASFTSSAAVAPHTVILDASGSTAVGGAAIVTYTWTFPDGSTLTGQVVTKAFPATGTIAVNLTVIDNATPPRSGTKTQAVVVP